MFNEKVEPATTNQLARWQAAVLCFHISAVMPSSGTKNNKDEKFRQLDFNDPHSQQKFRGNEVTWVWRDDE